MTKMKITKKKQQGIQSLPKNRSYVLILLNDL